MAANVSIPSIDLREVAARVKGLFPSKARQDFWFVGDASEVTFVLPKGWKPYAVYNAGLRVKDGALDEYTVTSENDVYSVIFAVAPGSGNSIAIDGVTL